MDMDVAPTDDTFLAILASRGNVPYARLNKEALGGRIFDEIPEVFVQPPGSSGGRFAVIPDDVAAEARAFAATPGVAELLAQNGNFPLRLICRRIREAVNTAYRQFPTARKRVPYNPLCAHPDDLVRLGIAEGTDCWVTSDHARIPAVAKADDTLKPGVVSMTHGFGGLVGEDIDYRESGALTSLLISLDRDYEPLQAMPRLSGIPVRVEVR